MKCQGCGIELQSEDPKVTGYIPQNALYERSEPLCQRCYRIKHYSENITPEVIHYTLADLKQVSNECQMTFVVVDLLDIEGTWNEDIRKAVGKNFFVILNKFDLIPKQIPASQIVAWFSKEYSLSRDLIQPISCFNNFGLKKLMEHINKLEKCCLTGATNAGKSTLLNKIISSEGLTPSTTSAFSGTTLGRVKRTLKSGTLLIDTPGVEIPTRMMQVVPPAERHLIFETKRLTRKTYKLKAGKTIFFGGLCRIDILKRNDEQYEPIFQLFSGHNVVYHLTQEKKAGQIHERHMGTLLKPPFSKAEFNQFEWKSQEFTLKEAEDLVISGLGWLNVKRGPLKILVTIPQEVSMKKRNAIFTKKR